MGCGRMGWCRDDWRPCDDRANGRFGRNGRGWRRSNDVGSLPGKRNDAARGNRCSVRRGRGCRRRMRCCDARRDRGCRRGGRRRDDRCGTWWGGLDGGIGLLALEDCLERVAGLRHLRQVELRLRVSSGFICAAAPVSAVEIGAYPLGLVGLDGAGVRLSGNADGFEGIQNRPALYFQFSCQIVNSNFAHPSLFASLRP